MEVNKWAKIYHESEVCEFRKVKCHDCVEIREDYAEMRKQIEGVKANMKELKDQLNQINV